MKINNWRAPALGMDSVDDWRSRVSPASRQRITNGVLGYLVKHCLGRAHEELKDIAVRFEAKMFTSATSQREYLEKISVKMTRMEVISRNAVAAVMCNSLQSTNSSSGSTNRTNPPANNTNNNNNVANSSLGNSSAQVLTMSNVMIGQASGLQNIQNLAAVDHRKSPVLGNTMVQSTYFSNQSQMLGREQLDSQQQFMKQTMQQQPQQQMTSQREHPQPGYIQQSLGLSQQANIRDMQQRVQTPNAIDHPKQLFQSHRPAPEASSASLDSTSQMGNSNGGDWQEEVYQKINTMKSMYLLPLNQLHKKLVGILQPMDSVPKQPESQLRLGKVKMWKTEVEKLLTLLQLPKSSILPDYKEKLGAYEKHIIGVLSFKRSQNANGAVLQRQSPSWMHSMQQLQQTQRQTTEVHPQENCMNFQMQTTNFQSSAATMQQKSMTGLQHNSPSPLSGVSNAERNMVPVGSPPQNPVSGSQQANNMNQLSSQRGMNTLRPNSNMYSMTNSLPQISVGSPPQNPTSCSQQANNTSQLSSQSGMNTLRPNSNMLQHQLLRQQEHMFQKPQVKKQLQDLMMQEHFLHQQEQQQTSQPLQLHPKKGEKEMRIRQQMGIKSGVSQQYHSQGTCADDQVLQRASPQIEQPNPLSSLPKAGMPLQNATSPSVVPQVAALQESGEVNSAISSPSSARNSGHQQTSGKISPVQLLTISTPGISPSPLLAEIARPDGDHENAATVVSGKSSAKEQPLEHLCRIVKSMSAKSLSASVSEIRLVFSMIDRIPGSAPSYGSRASVGEDFLDMSNYFLQDGTGGTRKRKHFISAVPLNHMTDLEVPELESIATSSIKRSRNEANHTLLEEIKKINRRLVDTVVEISTECVDRTAAAAACEGCEGTLVKCSYSAVALSPNLNLPDSSAQISPIQPLRLLVPKNYPSRSPILLDKFPAEVSKDCEDLSAKTNSMFSRSLRILSPLISLGEIARTWDACAHTVISEYGKRSGGGNFSSKYGTWEKY